MCLTTLSMEAAAADPGRRSGPVGCTLLASEAQGLAGAGGAGPRQLSSQSVRQPSTLAAPQEREPSGTPDHRRVRARSDGAL
jgi:hypothetical protein